MSLARRLPRGISDDRGSGDVLGLVLMAPIMLVFALLIFSLGRQVDAHAQVRSAAAAAAEAAALQRTPSLAESAALAAANRALVDPLACPGGPSIALDLEHFIPGGFVTVTLSCTPSTAGLGPLHPPSPSFSATAIATVDPLRASSP